MNRARLLLCLVSFLLPLEARADRAVIVQPGPGGEDTSAYSFLPSINFGQSENLYAFTTTDESGASHAMQTFIKIALPSDLLGPNESVKLAELWVDYAFDFTGFGNTNDSPGDLSCHVVSQAWSEANVTWGNKPAFGPARCW